MGLLIKMLKFERAKSSSLFSGEIMTINSLLHISAQLVGTGRLSENLLVGKLNSLDRFHQEGHKNKPRPEGSTRSWRQP